MTAAKFNSLYLWIFEYEIGALIHTFAFPLSEEEKGIYLSCESECIIPV